VIFLDQRTHSRWFSRRISCSPSKQPVRSPSIAPAGEILAKIECINAWLSGHRNDPHRSNGFHDLNRFAVWRESLPRNAFTHDRRAPGGVIYLPSPIRSFQSRVIDLPQPRRVQQSGRWTLPRCIAAHALAGASPYSKSNCRIICGKPARAPCRYSTRRCSLIVESFAAARQRIAPCTMFVVTS